jgi:hypothetical protein
MVKKVTWNIDQNAVDKETAEQTKKQFERKLNLMHKNDNQVNSNNYQS